MSSAHAFIPLSRRPRSGGFLCIKSDPSCHGKPVTVHQTVTLLDDGTYIVERDGTSLRTSKLFLDWEFPTHPPHSENGHLDRVMPRSPLVRAYPEGYEIQPGFVVRDGAVHRGHGLDMPTSSSPGYITTRQTLELASDPIIRGKFQLNPYLNASTRSMLPSALIVTQTPIFSGVSYFDHRALEAHGTISKHLLSQLSTDKYGQPISSTYNPTAMPPSKLGRFRPRRDVHVSDSFDSFLFVPSSDLVPVVDSFSATRNDADSTITVNVSTPSTVKIRMIVSTGCSDEKMGPGNLSFTCTEKIFTPVVYIALSSYYGRRTFQAVFPVGEKHCPGYHTPGLLPTVPFYYLFDCKPTSWYMPSRLFLEVIIIIFYIGVGLAIICYLIYMAFQIHITLKDKLPAASTCSSACFRCLCAVYNFYSSVMLYIILIVIASSLVTAVNGEIINCIGNPGSMIPESGNMTTHTYSVNCTDRCQYSGPLEPNSRFVLIVNGITQFTTTITALGQISGVGLIGAYHRPIHGYILREFDLYASMKVTLNTLTFGPSPQTCRLGDAIYGPPMRVSASGATCIDSFCSMIRDTPQCQILPDQFEPCVIPKCDYCHVNGETPYILQMQNCTDVCHSVNNNYVCSHPWPLYVVDDLFVKVGDLVADFRNYLETVPCSGETMTISGSGPIDYLSLPEESGKCDKNHVIQSCLQCLGCDRLLLKRLPDRLYNFTSTSVYIGCAMPPCQTFNDYQREIVTLTSVHDYNIGNLLVKVVPTESLHLGASVYVNESQPDSLYYISGGEELPYPIGLVNYTYCDLALGCTDSTPHVDPPVITYHLTGHAECQATSADNRVYYSDCQFIRGATGAPDTFPLGSTHLEYFYDYYPRSATPTYRTLPPHVPTQIPSQRPPIMLTPPNPIVPTPTMPPNTNQTATGDHALLTSAACYTVGYDCTSATQIKVRCNVALTGGAFTTCYACSDQFCTVVSLTADYGEFVLTIKAGRVLQTILICGKMYPLQQICTNRGYSIIPSLVLLSCVTFAVCLFGFVLLLISKSRLSSYQTARTMKAR